MYSVATTPNYSKISKQFIKKKITSLRGVNYNNIKVIISRTNNHNINSASIQTAAVNMMYEHIKLFNG